MKCIIFRTGNLIQTAIAAALCSTEMMCGVSYDGRYPIVDSKVQLNYEEIYKTCLEANKNELEENEKISFYVYSDVHLSEDFDVTVIENTRILFDKFGIMPRVRAFINDWHQHLDVVFMGLLEDSDIVTEDIKNNANLHFVSFLKFFKMPGIQHCEVAERYATIGGSQVSLMKRIIESYTPISLGDFLYYRAKEYVHFRVIKDISESKKVAVFRDNTGESAGSKVCMMLFVFGDDLPTEFSGLDFEEFQDPMVAVRCRRADVPFAFWANAMSDATYVKIDNTSADKKDE